MYEVKILRDKKQTHGGKFKTKQEANNWIKSGEDKKKFGNPEKIMVVTEVQPPMELIEEVKGPMGIKAFKVRLPADYEVVIEEVLPEPKEVLKEIQEILKATDWLFISDVPLTKEYRVEFKNYRQYLRDARHNSRIENFEQYLRRVRPEYFMEGRDGPKMVKKFNTYIK